VSINPARTDTFPLRAAGRRSGCIMPVMRRISPSTP